MMKIKVSWTVRLVLILSLALMGPEMIGQDLSSVQSELESSKDTIMNILNIIFGVIIVTLAIVVVYQLVNNPQGARNYIIGLVGGLIVWGIIFSLFS